MTEPKDASGEHPDLGDLKTSVDPTSVRTVLSATDPGPASSMQALAAGLELRGVLGEGGMGKVYLAFDATLGRNVALKVLSVELSDSDRFRQAFVSEARTNALLNHPAIVPIHTLSAGPGSGLSFTMQAVQGQTLRAWMHEPHHGVGSSQRLEQGLEILLKVCDALAYAHSRGILHCDLKPDNIMVGDYGSIYLMDWGLSRPRFHELPASPCGTPGYMAPEQARNEFLDERSDVFGLGVILLELVSGETPYGHSSEQDFQARTSRGDLREIGGLLRGLGVSARLCEIIERAVAPSREDRYPTVAALRDEIHAFLRGGFHLPRHKFGRYELIVKEGETQDSAYLIVSGRCRVFRKVDGDEVTLRYLEPGDIFGELALLLETPRTASVEAVEPCTVLVIDRARVEASGALEGWTAALMRALAQRFRELEVKVADQGIR